MSQREKVLLALEDWLLNQEKRLIASIDMAAEAAREDSKSSAGDKYETGREMAQQEITKLQNQLLLNRQHQAQLIEIKEQKHAEIIVNGSLISTNLRVYFLGMALGEIKVEGLSVFAISQQSPIGQLLLKKQKGDKIQLNGRLEEILSVE